MSKVRVKQRTIIRDLIKYFDGLQHTNDIESPSHSNLIEEECRLMQDNYSLDDVQTKELNASLWNILNVIRKI